METLNKAINQLHILAQFPAAFSNSYLEKREDDSQAALLWTGNGVSSQKVNEYVLVLDYAKKVLMFLNKEISHQIPVEGKFIDEITSSIVDFISSSHLDGRKFSLSLNYDLPLFDQFNNAINLPEDFVLSEISKYRSLAQEALTDLMAKENHTSEIFIWPHHFDTGLLIGEDARLEKGFGLGYAKADHVHDSPYYYIYNYPSFDIDYRQEFDPVFSDAQWIDQDNWKGAILPASMALSAEEVQDFYRASLKQLRNYKK